MASYLRSTNKAHIDTGISQLTVGKFEIRFCAVNYRYDGGTDWQKIAGGRSSHNVNNALSVYYNFSNKWVGAAIGGTFVDALFYNINLGEWHTISWDYSTQKVSLDGQEASTTFPIPTGTSYNFFLFATDGQQSQEFPGKIAYCKLWDKSGNLIFDGTPYRKNFSVGMMDSVSGDVFYGDTVYSSPGDLVYGEMQPSSGLRYYDYLIGDGLSYIDTGIDVSGASFGIDGTFIRLRDASNEDTIISNFTGALGYFSVFISAYHSQKIDLYLREHVLVGDSVPAIGREVPISLSWDNDIYTISTIGTTISATQANAQTNTVRILARGENIGSYPCPVMAIKGPWTISKGGVIVRSLRPCSYNGVAGMYDSVNDVFYPSANTVGEFALADSESRVISINHLSLGDFRRRIMMGISKENKMIGPASDGRIWAYYDVTSTSNPTTICGDISNISAIEVDDISYLPSTTFVFASTGLQCVKFTLIDDSTTGDRLFDFSSSRLSKVYLPETVLSLGDYAFRNAGICYTLQLLSNTMPAIGAHDSLPPYCNRIRVKPELVDTARGANWANVGYKIMPIIYNSPAVMPPFSQWTQGYALGDYAYSDLVEKSGALTSPILYVGWDGVNHTVQLVQPYSASSWGSPKAIEGATYYGKNDYTDWWSNIGAGGRTVTLNSKTNMVRVSIREEYKDECGLYDQTDGVWLFKGANLT